MKKDNKIARAEKERELKLLRELQRRKGSRNEIYETYRQFKGRYAVLIGGSGSGKSYEAADKHIDRVITEDNHRILCCRAEQKQISESMVPLIVDRIKKRSNLDLWKINLSKGNESITYLPNGNKFIFWGLDDPDKLRSIFDISSVWMEESDQAEEEAFNELDRRLRGYQGTNKNGTEKYMQITFTFNPVFETSWLNENFFKKKDTNQLMLCGIQHFDDCTNYKEIVIPDLNEKIKVYNAKLGKEIERYRVNTLIVHSTYLDNIFIDDTYTLILLRLKESHPDQYNVFALGQWGSYGGNYFNEFRKDVHVIKPFTVPTYWKKFISLDYGLDMTSCCWWTIAPDGMEYIYKEFNQKDLILSQAAKEILSRIEPDEKISYVVASPDLWNRRQDSGDSGQEIMYKAGLKGLTKADNRRVEGWRNLKEHLFIYENIEHKEVATLRIFNTCRKTIDSISIVQVDKHDPEDVADEPHEYTHAVENIRYGAFSRPRPNKVAETFVQPAGTMSRLAEEQLRNIEKKRKTKNFV